MADFFNRIGRHQPLMAFLFGWSSPNIPPALDHPSSLGIVGLDDRIAVTENWSAGLFAIERVRVWSSAMQTLGQC